MFRRYAYILFLTALAATLKMGSRAPQHEEDLDWANNVSQSAPVFTIYDEDRRELLEAMDQIVEGEKYYHSISGRFTPNLSDLEFVLPEAIQGRYEVGISEASDTKLLVAAYSLKSDRLASGSDQVSLDQSYRLNANFPIPQPRSQYLRARAERHLRDLAGMPRGQIVTEPGVFRGYFRYDVSVDGEGARNAVALGVKPPVLGFRLTLNSKNGVQADSWRPHWDLGEPVAPQDATPVAGSLPRLESDLETIANADISGVDDRDRRVAGKVSSFDHPRHGLVIEKIGP